MASPAPQPTLSARLAAFRKRHARAEMLAFFTGGFLFDARMLRRIDDTTMLVQQGAYLLGVGVLLAAELYLHATHREPPKKAVRKLWRLADPALHFMMGTLLNAFALFYFKSGTGLTAALFAVVVAGLLLANEHPYFHKLGPVVLVSLYSFCLTSYFAYLIPVWAGSIRPWMFGLAATSAAVPLALLFLCCMAWSDRLQAVRRVAIPGMAVQVALVALYFLRLIPPVPLSVEQMGIYHAVERDPAAHQYLLSHLPGPTWAFWRKGDQDFLARPGDRIYCFVRIFAPRNFRDRVFIRFAFQDPKRGWVLSDAIPLNIVGGREDGYGGYAYKAHYQPGRWRVTVELADGREIGSLHLTVRDDPETGPRTLVQDKG